MSMTYDEFKNYLRSFLWKLNDAQLLNDLDNLIILGTSELDRKLDINRREANLAWQSVQNDTNKQDVPNDLKHIIALNSDYYSYEVVSEGQIQHELNVNSTNRERPYVSVVGSQLAFGHTFPAANQPINYQLVYRTKLPDYKATDASWVEDEYLDLYTYTILKHTAPWLREDERVPLWQQYSTDALSSVLEDDKFNIEYGSSPIKMNMPRSPVPNQSRRGRPGTLYRR